MLSNEVMKYPVGTELAIISPHQSNRGRAEDSTATTRPDRVVMGKLLSKNKARRYAVSGLSWGTSAGDFLTTTDRDFGWLVEYNNRVYSIRSKEIVATSEEYNTHWEPVIAREKVEQQERDRLNQIRMEKEQARYQISSAKESQALPLVESTKSSATENILSIIGKQYEREVSVSAKTDGRWVTLPDGSEDYFVEVNGTVTITLKAFNRLLLKLSN
jgi:hypothetical protein